MAIVLPTSFFKLFSYRLLAYRFFAACNHVLVSRDPNFLIFGNIGK
jgi:hypothetical protein